MMPLLSTYMSIFGLQRHLSIRATPIKGHLPNVDTVCNSNHIRRSVYKSTS